MSQNVLLFIIGLAGVLLVVTGVTAAIAAHDRDVLQERRVVAAQQSSGAGCLAWLVVLLVAGLALWAYLGPGS
jgi:hypothetical protein